MSSFHVKNLKNLRMPESAFRQRRGYQTEPSASFDSVFQSRGHRRAAGLGRGSTFLPPFAPPELPGFSAPTTALTSAALACDECLNGRAALCAYDVWPSGHSIPNPPYCPSGVLNSFECSYSSSGKRATLRSILGTELQHFGLGQHRGHSTLVS